jgi:hypothetical protein
VALHAPAGVVTAIGKAEIGARATLPGDAWGECVDSRANTSGGSTGRSRGHLACSSGNACGSLTGPYRDAAGASRHARGGFAGGAQPLAHWALSAGGRRHR